MNRQIRKVLIGTVAVLFLIAGVAGIFLPFLQGFIFLAIGIALLSLISSRVRAWLERRTTKYPRVHQAVGHFQKMAEKILGKSD